MNIVYLMLPVALLISFSFLFAFLKSGSSGQYEDLDTPPYRILIDDQPLQKPEERK